MDDKQITIDQINALIDKWNAGYREVSHASDNIHDDSGWEWSDTDDLVFLSSILLTIIEGKES